MGELKLVQTSFPAVLWAARKDSVFIHSHDLCNAISFVPLSIIPAIAR